MSDVNLPADWSSQIPDNFKTNDGYLSMQAFNFIKCLLYDTPFSVLLYQGTEDAEDVHIDSVELEHFIVISKREYDPVLGVWNYTEFDPVSVLEVRYKVSGLSRDLDFKVPTWSGVITNASESIVNLLEGEFKKLTFKYYVRAYGIHDGERDSRISLDLFTSEPYLINKVEIDNDSLDSMDDTLVTPYIGIEGVPFIYKYNNKFRYCAKIGSHSSGANIEDLDNISDLFDTNEAVSKQLSINYPGFDISLDSPVLRDASTMGYYPDTDAFIQSTELPFKSVEDTFLTCLSKVMLFNGFMLSQGSGEGVAPEVFYRRPRFFIINKIDSDIASDYVREDGMSYNKSCQIMNVYGWYNKYNSTIAENYPMQLFYDFGYVDNNSTAVISYSKYRYTITYGYSARIVNSKPDKFEDDAGTHVVYSLSSQSIAAFYGVSKQVSSVLTKDYSIDSSRFYKENNQKHGVPDDILVSALVVEAVGSASTGRLLDYQVNKDGFEFLFPQYMISGDYNNGQFVDGSGQFNIPDSADYLNFYMVTYYLLVQDSRSVYENQALDLSTVEVSVSYPFFSGFGIFNPSGGMTRHKVFSWLDTCQALRSYADYIVGEATFTSFWYPWVKVYDVVSFVYKKSKNVYERRFGFVIDIDVQADTQSAVYKVLVSNYPIDSAPIPT